MLITPNILLTKYVSRIIKKYSPILKQQLKSNILQARMFSAASDNINSGPLTQSRKAMASISDGDKSHDVDLERDKVGQWATNHGDHYIPSMASGIGRLKTPNINKGLAYTIEERQLLGIHGLLPPVVKTQEEQIFQVKMNLDRYENMLDKYMWLIDLLNRNEKLFYATVRKYVLEFLPVLYTPTVGYACEGWGMVYRWPRGIYITIYDKGHVYDILRNWPEDDVRVIVFTDGERILGLGDLGTSGMGIPIGKLCLYTAIGGIKPHYCLPVTIDVGTNNEKMLKDPLYLGIREKRHRGPEYDELIAEFMAAVVKRWGQNTLIQFEDFGNANAFRLLDKYKDKYCTFNDDIQGTAAVVVAGLLAALKVTKNRLSDHTILFQGAGEANLGTAALCVTSMVATGMSPEEARKKIWMVDSKGLIVKDRPGGKVESHKALYAHDHKHIKSLSDVVKEIKPSILIGAAAVGKVFTPEILQEMAKNNKRPIVFALSNPTPKAECTPEEAYKETKGTVIYASGSPFPPVQYEGKSYTTGQANNSYIFPACGLAAITAGIPHFTDEHFMIAAQALADLVTEEDLSIGRVLPSLENILEVSTKIATKLVEHSYQQCMATVYPEPDDKEAYIRANMYSTDYEPAFKCPYEFPEQAEVC